MEKCLEGNIRGKCCGMCLWVEHPIWESGNDPNGVLFHTMYLGALKALRNPVLSLCRVFLLLLFFFFLCTFAKTALSVSSCLVEANGSSQLFPLPGSSAHAFWGASPSE